MVSKVELERVLDFLDLVSKTWEQEGHAERYARSLVEDAGYVPCDAAEEAAHAGVVMSRPALEPFLVQAPYESLADVADAAARFRRRHPRPSIFVLGSGNIGLPLVLNAALGLAADKTVYARPSRRNLGAIRTWRDALSCPHLVTRIGDPLVGKVQKRLCESIELIELTPQDPGYADRLSRLPVQHAFLWGGDEALRSTEAMLADGVGDRVYRFGPRTGVYVLECAWWCAIGEEEKRQVAQACYDNITKYDAALCSSPSFGVLIGGTEERREVLAEMVARMVPAATERERCRRLPGANARRRQMEQWVAHGYTVHRPEGSVVTLALGDTDSYQRKNTYNPPMSRYHDTAGSLELIAFREADIAKAAGLVAGLQGEPRYEGQLWSVGHLAMAASPGAVRRFVDAFGRRQEETGVLKSDARCLPAADVRVVDIRHNLERTPGEAFDGVALMPAMLRCPVLSNNV